MLSDLEREVRRGLCISLRRHGLRSDITAHGQCLHEHIPVRISSVRPIRGVVCRTNLYFCSAQAYFRVLVLLTDSDDSRFVFDFNESRAVGPSRYDRAVLLDLKKVFAIVFYVSLRSVHLAV